MSRKNTEQSFWATVMDRANPDGCWEWPGSPSQKYGEIKFGGRRTRAHRVAWQLANGVTIPDGMFVCHKCDNPRCANPGHLFLGTSHDNFRDMVNKGRMAVGERVSTAKLTEADVREIRASDEMGITLAAKYGVNKATISSIKLRKKWKHIP